MFYCQTFLKFNPYVRKCMWHLRKGAPHISHKMANVRCFPNYLPFCGVSTHDPPMLLIAHKRFWVKRLGKVKFWSNYCWSENARDAKNIMTCKWLFVLMMMMMTTTIMMMMALIKVMKLIDSDVTWHLRHIKPRLQNLPKNSLAIDLGKISNVWYYEYCS